MTVSLHLLLLVQVSERWLWSFKSISGRDCALFVS